MKSIPVIMIVTGWAMICSSLFAFNVLYPDPHEIVITREQHAALSLYIPGKENECMHIKPSGKHRWEQCK